MSLGELGLDRLDRQKKNENTSHAICCAGCEVGGRRVFAGREKSVEGSGRCPDVEKRTVHTCVAVWGL